jgi:hypothetical protein
MFTTIIFVFCQLDSHLAHLPLGNFYAEIRTWNHLHAAPFSPGVRRRCGDAVRGLGGATTRRCQLEGS